MLQRKQDVDAAVAETSPSFTSWWFNLEIVGFWWSTAHKLILIHALKQVETMTKQKSLQTDSSL